MERLLKWFAQGDEGVCVRLSWFMETFPPTGFEGVDQMLYFFLGYCDKLGIGARRDYLEAFMRTEGKQVIKRESIRVTATQAYDYEEPGALEEAYRVIASAVAVRFDQCMEVDIAGKVFKAEMKAYMETRKTKEVQMLLADAYPKLSSGDSIDELIDQMQVRLSGISQAYSDENLDALDFLEDRSYTKGGKDRQNFLFQTGIPCIDGDIGGMYTKQLWTFTGPPGGGKTRFSLARFAYQAAVRGHYDVLYDELELSKGEVEDILVAHHIINIYKGKIKIPDRDMVKRRLDTKQQQIYEAAKMDLFESGKYGKIVISCKGLEVETMKKKRLQYFKTHPKTKLWVVDYLGLLESKPQEKYAKHMVKYEIITEGIEIIKKITTVADLGALCLCQYNDEGIKASMMGKPIMPGMTEGGHVIQRHSDYDIAMTMTEEQELARMCELSTIKKRAAAGFKNVPLRTDKSVSIFEQVSKM